VGTRGDKVTDPRLHEDISNRLEELFAYNLIWSNLVVNKDGQGRNGLVTLNFFPVNNKAKQSERD
jgi:hypothetical protein